MVSKSAVFFILVQVVCAAPVPEQECAYTVPESSRSECGYNGITQAACEQKGCCWKPTADATNPHSFPWCFLSAQIINPNCPHNVYPPGVASPKAVDQATLGEPIGWAPTGTKEGGDKWCATQGPAADWDLTRMCGALTHGQGLTGAAAQIKVLTYNLQWWKNFKYWSPSNTINPALGANMVKDGVVQKFDLMGFQECENVDAIVGSAVKQGLKGNWKTYGVHGENLCQAWDGDVFTELSRGKAYIGEDENGVEYYGRRAAQWVRLTHKPSGKTVFYINHHGPLPINTGGQCGPRATAYNLLKTMGRNAMKGDLIFMTCDCNAWSMFQPPNEPTRPWRYLDEIGTLACHIGHYFTNPTVEDVWGIDNHFSNCATPAKTGWTVKTAGTVMGKGGSDHYALSLVYDLPGSSAHAQYHNLTRSITV